MSNSTTNGIVKLDPTIEDDSSDDEDEAPPANYGKLTYNVNSQDSVYYLKKFRNLLGRSKICDFV
jgi:hypothetical protein